MSKKNDYSNEIESKNSHIIVISKGRLSSAKNKENYMTLQEGQHKLTIKMKKEELSKHDISQAVSSLKKEILKISKSSENLDYENKKVNISSNIKNLLQSPINEKDSNNNQIKKIKLKSILSAETTKSLNAIKSTENNKDDDIYYNYNSNKINVIDTDYKNNMGENNDLNKNDEKENQINDEDTININIKNGNINENNSSRKIISQNYLNNIPNNSSKMRTQTLNRYKSEEIRFINSNRMNEEDKKNDNIKEKNAQPSEITTKSILGSVRNPTMEENNQMKLYHLITENDIEGKISVKSKNDLLSENKSIKIDENEEEESEEIEDDNEYDEKIKNDNNRKMIKNLIINNTNNLFNIDNNKENENQKIQKIKNEFKSIEPKANVIKSLEVKNNDKNNIFRMCSICEHTYPMTRLFVAKCEDHYLCKRCTKNYFEEIIEDGSKEILCPFTQCKAKVDIKNLLNIISLDHYRRLTSENQDNEDDDKEEKTKNKLFFTKIKGNYRKENIKLYTKKHVIDINSNKNFFNYNNAKMGYCPYCCEESLFSKTNTHYSKCFNCLSKICKYCYKEFVDGHIDIHNLDHCKVYYRLEATDHNNTIIINYVKQLFFVVACFLLTFIGSFYFYRETFFYCFHINTNRNIFGYILAYFFTIIFFILSLPFIFLLYPYYPSILSLCDYN